MKRLLIILFTLAFSMNSYTQNCVIDTFDNPSLKIVYTSLRKRGLTRGIDIDTLTNKLYNGYQVRFKGIKLVDTVFANGKYNPTLLGVVHWNPVKYWYEPDIQIRSDLEFKLFELEEVLAHELGHLWGLDHSCFACGDVMSSLMRLPYSKNSPLYEEKFLNKIKTKKKWDRFFDKLKDKE